MSVNKINDGGKSYGSSTLNIKKFNGTTYISRGTYLTDDFAKTQATKSVDFTDPDDIPNGQVTTRGLETGTATAQFATSTTPELEIGDAFKWTNPESIVSYYYLDSVGRTERKGEESKQGFTFRKVLNPTLFKVTAVGGSEVGPLDLTALL